MIAAKAVHLLILCQVILRVSAECPMFMSVCSRDCVHGLDSNGCATCDCPKTCEYTKCSDGQKCLMYAVNCTKKSCDLQPTCVPNYLPKNCTTAVCYEPCVADIGPDGCYSKCSCPQTCQDIKCTDYEVCELLEVQCIRAPCFPVPTCFPKNKTCSERPNVKRCRKNPSSRWTFNPNANSCRLFPYYGCTPSPNTFTSYQECVDTCVRSCPSIMCMENCYSTPKTPGTCPECVCPCQTVKCKAGTECRLKEGNCTKGEPCYPTAYCAPVPTKPTTKAAPCPKLLCLAFCENGHVKDKNGCDTCACKTDTSYPKPGHV